MTTPIPPKLRALKDMEKNPHILKMYIWQHKNFETFVFMVLKLVKAMALIRLSEKINTAHTVHKYEAIAI